MFNFEISTNEITKSAAKKIKRRVIATKLEEELDSISTITSDQYRVIEKRIDYVELCCKLICWIIPSATLTVLMYLFYLNAQIQIVTLK